MARYPRNEKALDIQDGVATITLKALHGTYEILVDAADLDLFDWRRVYITGNTTARNKYAKVYVGSGPEKKGIRLHRLINGTPDDLATDHLNGNKLDNRRANLETVTTAENTRRWWASRKAAEGCHEAC